MNRLKIVVGLITRENDYQLEQAAVAEATAQRLGVAVDVVWAEGDAIAQTRQLLANIHAPDRPDAIIVEPVGTGMSGVAAAAANAGVGWVVLNREADYLIPIRDKAKVPIGSVDCDNVEVGRIQGRQVATLLPAGGTLLYIEGPAADPSRQRRAGLEETLPKNVEVKSLRGKWTEESGYQAVASRLERQGTQPANVDVIGCQNDAMAMGARKAIDALPPGAQRNEWLRIPLTGVDGVPASGKAWVDRGLLAATVITPALTGVALELVVKALSSGAQMPERTLTKASSYPPVEQLRPRPAEPAR